MIGHFYYGGDANPDDSFEISILFVAVRVVVSSLRCGAFGDDVADGDLRYGKFSRVVSIFCG